MCEHAKEPTYATKGSVGLDLYSTGRYEIKAGQSVCVNVGFRILKFPYSCYGRIAGRSGFATKGIHAHGGVIDVDYKGDIKVLLYNSNKDEDVIIEDLTRVAQLVIERYNKVEVRQTSPYHFDCKVAHEYDEPIHHHYEDNELNIKTSVK